MLNEATIHADDLVRNSDINSMNLFNRPYDLLESTQFKYAYVFGGAVFTMFFLWVFEPFGIYDLSVSNKWVAISCYLALGVLLLSLQFFVFQKYLIKKYTVGITLLWLLLSFFILGLAVFIVNAFLFNEGVLRFTSYLYFQKIIFSINIIPTLFLVLVHYNYLLRKRLHVASQVNEKLNTTSNERHEPKTITIQSDNKKDWLEIALDDLLYIQSADNYVKVFFMEETATANKLIRISLSKIEKQYEEEPAVFRCHKSYIINKRKIELISGNAAGYKIKLMAVDELIPVSRNLNKSILNLKND